VILEQSLNIWAMLINLELIDKLQPQNSASTLTSFNVSTVLKLFAIIGTDLPDSRKSAN
jgi:hypothetical protein